MRIETLSSDPFAHVPFLNATQTRGVFAEEQLPLFTGTAGGLPSDLDALVLTADLQGRETFENSGGLPPRLLGEAVAERLGDDLLPSCGLARPERVGIVLAGDFYTVPNLDRRGGIGDVTSVWRAFGDRFAWVAGVAGNHDAFGDDLHAPPRFHGNLRFLDGEHIEFGSLRIAGVSGMIGDVKRPWRRSTTSYLEHLERALSVPSDLLVLHDGPPSREHGFVGTLAILEGIEKKRPSLVVRGHRHWPVPLVELACGTQVLNVDGRVVILTRCDE